MTLQKPRNFTFTLKGNAYQNFEYGLNSNAEATKKSYRYALERYGWYIGTKLGWTGEHTPDGFIFKDDVSDNKNHQIESLLSGWISKLQEGQRLKSSSVRQFVAAIKLFYEMNSIALPWKKIKRGIKRTNPHKDRAYTREEIKLLLSHVGLRLRAIILLLSSSGVRVGALPALKLEHLTKIEQYSLYMLTVYADEPQQYFTFTTPEAAEAIDQYLAHRKRAGEAMTPESPLFRDEFNCEIVESAQDVKPLSVYDIKNLIRAATHRAGIRVNKRNLDPTIAGSIRHEVKQVHGFRKYFYTCLRTSNVDPIICEMLVGHRTGSIRDGITSLMLVYDRPDKSQLLAEYLKAVERLAIGDEKKLEAQISQLQLQKEQETANADAIAVLSDKLIAVMQELEELKGQNKN